MTEDRKPSEIPHLHVRPPRRVVGVGGEGDRPVGGVYANRAGLRRFIADAQRALEAEEGMAVESTRYFEIDGREFDLWVMRCTHPKQMGEAREPERPDRSMFA